MGLCTQVNATWQSSQTYWWCQSNHKTSFASKGKPGCDEWSKCFNSWWDEPIDSIFSDCSFYLSLLFSPGHEIMAGTGIQLWFGWVALLPRNSSAIPGGVTAASLPWLAGQREVPNVKSWWHYSRPALSGVWFLGGFGSLGGSGRLKGCAGPVKLARVLSSEQCLNSAHSSCWSRREQLFHALWFLVSSSLSIQLIFGLERLWYLYWSCELTDMKLFPLPV